MSARAWRRRRGKSWRRAVLAPRCMACAGTRCPGLARGIESCPRWQEAEARAEYLPTYPLTWSGDVKAPPGPGEAWIYGAPWGPVRVSPRAAELLDRIEADE